MRRQLSKLKSNMIRQLNRMRSVETIFNSIYHHHGWGDGQSVSGTGSNVEQTYRITQILPELFRRYEIRTILDIPCGDFNWMQRVDLSGIDYSGADIVRPIIEANIRRYRKEGVRFFTADLTTGPIDKYDLIFCRDCLVHLSNKHVFHALKTVIDSGSTFLLTTTFPGHANIDIVTGSWRPINLQRDPFMLPVPLEVVNEGYHSMDSGVSEKSLALWRVADLRSLYV